MVIMILLSLFKFSVKNISEGRGRFKFCCKAPTFKNLSLYLLHVIVLDFKPTRYPQKLLTQHSHASCGKALVL